MENLCKNTFLLDEKLGLHRQKSEKPKKIVANSGDKSFK